MGRSSTRAARWGQGGGEGGAGPSPGWGRWGRLGAVTVFFGQDTTDQPPWWLFQTLLTVLQPAKQQVMCYAKGLSGDSGESSSAWLAWPALVIMQWLFLSHKGGGGHASITFLLLPCPPSRGTTPASLTTAVTQTARRRSGWCAASWPSGSSRSR